MILSASLSTQPTLNVWRRTAECRRSVLFGQHDGDDALGDRGIGRVGRVIREAFVEVINLEKEFVPVDFEYAEIVLFVWVIGVAEIIVHGDGFNDASDGFGAEGGDTGCDQGRTDGEVLAQFVVERANGFKLRSSLLSPDCLRRRAASASVRTGSRSGHRGLMSISEWPADQVIAGGGGRRLGPVRDPSHPGFAVRRRSGRSAPTQTAAG